MRVLHLSSTPLVGAPIRICRALSRLPGVEARCAVARTDVGVYGKLSFQNDLVMSRDAASIARLAEGADILHLHNTVDLDNREFGLDLRAMHERGKPMVRQMHSTPALISRRSGKSEEELLACPLPRLVIAQYPERFLPDARLVPNIAFPEDAPASISRSSAPLRIGFAPSRFNSSRSSRWDTKGYPETVRLLRKLKRESEMQGLAVEIDIIENVPYAECLARKSKCDLVLDDLVTGSYHLNTLESLAAGIAVMTYMDVRTVAVQTQMTGGEPLPVINVGLENAFEPLLSLVREPSIARALGARSRAWMAQYWRPERLTEFFLDAYGEVIANPRRSFPARFNDHDMLDQWIAVGLQDSLWKARSMHWEKEAPAWWRGLRSRAWRAAHALGLR